jgi:ADP-ribose pyrophosphatase YjhB (NUDIX family)
LELLLENKIFFEAYAINVSDATPEYTKLQIPYRQLYERALQFAKSSEKNIIDLLSELPFSQQKTLEKILLKIDPKFRNQSSGKQLGRPVVVSLESHYHNPPIKGLRKFKAFFSSQNSQTRGQCITITLLRLEVPKEDDEDDEDDEDEAIEEEKRQKALKLVEQEKEQAEKKAAEEVAKRAAEADAKKKAKSDPAAAALATAFSPPPAPKSPIKFKDAVGRKFTFPFELCCTWGVYLTS